MQKSLPRPNFSLCYLRINSGIACSSDWELCIGERCCKCYSARIICQVSFFPSLVGSRPQGCDPQESYPNTREVCFVSPHVPPVR